MDNFQASHPGCKEIEGNIAIMHNDVFDRQTTIYGALKIEYNNIVSFGFPRLVNTGGNLHIYYNQCLTTLDGLDALKAIVGVAGQPADGGRTSAVARCGSAAARHVSHEVSNRQGDGDRDDGGHR
jgi:hypothetical protein